MSALVRGRKLKGEKVGRSITLPLRICEALQIDPGDLLEFEIRRVIKKIEEDGSFG